MFYIATAMSASESRKSCMNSASAQLTCLIDMKLLSTDEGFIDSIGLDTNSVSGSDAWSEHLAPQSGGPNNEMYSLILDQLHVNLLLNTVHACQDSRILASLQVLCRAG